MSVGFFINSPKLLRSSINVIVLHDGNRYKRGLGLSIDVKQWNKKKQISVSGVKYPEGTHINFEIEKLRMAIERLLHNIKIRGIKIPDSKHFWQLVDCELLGADYVSANPTGELFVAYFEKVFIQKFMCQKTESRITRFKVILQKIKDYERERNKQLRFVDIDVTFYRDLQAYMNSLRHSTNYFGTVIKVIKQVMREAQDIDKLHDNREFSGANFKALTQEVDAIYLTIKELEQIHNTLIDDNFIDKMFPRIAVNCFVREQMKRSYNIVKNRFLIGAFTGMRVSDFNAFNRDSVVNGSIVVISAKTKQRNSIPIHWIVKEILDSDFDLSQSLSDAKTRIYIKTICCYAGINDVVQVRQSIAGQVSVNKCYKWQLVGTHTARRSFVSNAIKDKLPLESIMLMTGHTTVKSLLTYARITSEENADMLRDHPYFKGRE